LSTHLVRLADAGREIAIDAAERHGLQRPLLTQE
jgi:urocanate hydratase